MQSLRLVFWLKGAPKKSQRGSLKYFNKNPCHSFGWPTNLSMACDFNLGYMLDNQGIKKIICTS
jgi:hypothetical protein